MLDEPPPGCGAESGGAGATAGLGAVAASATGESATGLATSGVRGDTTTLPPVAIRMRFRL